MQTAAAEVTGSFTPEARSPSAAANTSAEVAAAIKTASVVSPPFFAVCKTL